MQLYYTKIMKVMKEGIYIGQSTTICFVFLGDHVYFEILCTMTMEILWVLRQGVHSTTDR
jgi:hypothetical protein